MISINLLNVHQTSRQYCRTPANLSCKDCRSIHNLPFSYTNRCNSHFMRIHFAIKIVFTDNCVHTNKTLVAYGYISTMSWIQIPPRWMWYCVLCCVECVCSILITGRKVMYNAIYYIYFYISISDEMLLCHIHIRDLPFFTPKSIHFEISLSKQSHMSVYISTLPE